LREWAGILVFGTSSIQCAAQPIGISASVPPQDLGFGRRAARLAVQCAFRNEEETRSEFLPFRQRPNGVQNRRKSPNVFLCSPVFSGEILVLCAENATLSLANSVEQNASRPT